MRRRRWHGVVPRASWVPPVVAVLLLAAGCSLIGDDGPDPEPTAAAFAAAWSEGDQSAMAALTTSDGRETDLAIRQFQGELEVESTDVVVGTVERSGDEATAPLTVTHELAGLGPWTYETTLPLELAEGQWAVPWSTSILHPELVDGRRVARQRSPGDRGPILAQAGQPLAQGNPPERAPQAAPLTVGELTTVDRAGAEQLGPEYAAGDSVGASGLEQAYERDLAGQPTGAVQLLEPTGEVVEDLVTFEGSAGAPVTTTLDLGMQQAADAAVSGSSLPVAMVVLDAATGAVRAVANSQAGFDRAFLGEYPPGSTFKIITATAMLAAGIRPEDTLPCPFETRPGDARPFTNAFGKDGGIVTFEKAFAESCNTTFVNGGFEIGAEAMMAQAEQYGFNSGFDPGIPAVVGKFPLPESDTELASASIGQGRVSVSPLHMASVAAAARTGTWHAPYLVEPTPQLDRALPDGAAENLTRFMRSVVQDPEGTAPNVAVAGYDVGGKTGTAEFGDEDPPQTHAWFVGFVDDLAYAVVVEAGGVGATAAGPIARSFIESRPRIPAGDGAQE